MSQVVYRMLEEGKTAAQIYAVTARDFPEARFHQTRGLAWYKCELPKLYALGRRKCPKGSKFKPSKAAAENAKRHAEKLSAE